MDVTPPATPKNLPLKANITTRSCIIRLEILTEADIVQHVHVHKNQPTSNQTAVKPDSVETVETGYRTHSSLHLKPSRSNRLPRAVSTDVTYTNQDELSDTDCSPIPKRKKDIRPRKEPSASRIKSDSSAQNLQV